MPNAIARGSAAWQPRDECGLGIADIGGDLLHLRIQAIGVDTTPADCLPTDRRQMPSSQNGVARSCAHYDTTSEES
jgi:hypothetical protein